ncbi:MAG TPA: hypothetical protein VFY18_09705 [Candidatus Limnocylindrales bacterium]|nr:hypothetical protein [Candidatus Limnocylindrales bacterium]
MPTRRTSPRRSATRPTVPLGEHDGNDDFGGGGRLAAAAPWLAMGAVVVAIAALAVTLLGRGSGGDLDACRRAAWAAVPATSDLPQGWTLSTTDLNANGMTVSILGQPSTDGTAGQPVVYASVTCYGEVAATALSQYRVAAKAAGAQVTDRGLGGDAYDVDNPATGSVTTLFRIGGLIGQIADAGSATPTELGAITAAVAGAMGDRSAAGTSTNEANASQAVGSGEPSIEPGASDQIDASTAPTAPELEALLPTEVGGTTLTVQSATATDGLGTDPTSRAFAAVIPTLGAKLADLQVAQAFDETQTVDLSIFGFRLAGRDGTKLRAAVIDTWLSAGAAGVTRSEVKLAGKSLTKIDYGDAGAIDYVYSGSDYVIVIETVDLAIATEVAGKLK